MQQRYAYRQDGWRYLLMQNYYLILMDDSSTLADYKMHESNSKILHIDKDIAEIRKRMPIEV